MHIKSFINFSRYGQHGNPAAGRGSGPVSKFVFVTPMLLFELHGCKKLFGSARAGPSQAFVEEGALKEPQSLGTSESFIFGLLPPCLAFKCTLCANFLQDTSLTMKRLARMRGQWKQQALLMTHRVALEQANAGVIAQVFCRECG